MPTTPREIIIVLGATLFIFVITFFVVAFIMLYQKRKKQYEQERELMQARFQEEALRSQLEMQEQTFKKISEEIHDNIGQMLSLAKLNLNSVKVTDESQEKKISGTKELVSKAIQDLRSLSKSFHTDRIAQIGIAEAIRYELELINNTGEYRSGFENHASSINIGKEKELLLFRITQEVLNNTIKHAKGNLITVVMNSSNGILDLSVSDNGNGFDVKSLQQDAGAGLGLRNLYNRASIMGATLTIESAAGKGTVVKISMANS